MRTNIEIDDKLMKRAMKATGATTKKATVEASLAKVVELSERQGILKWFGNIDWEGDLDAMRQGKLPEWEATHGRLARQKKPKNKVAASR